jgi:hypothetical protein
MAQEPKWAKAEDSCSHSDTPQMVGLLWMSDQFIAETSTWQRNTLNRQTSMPPAGFELTTPMSERPQTHALDRATTGIGHYILLQYNTLSLIPLLLLLLFFLPTFPTYFYSSFLPATYPLPHPHLSFLLHSFPLFSSIFHSVFPSISRRTPHVRYMFCIFHTGYTSSFLCILM